LHRRRHVADFHVGEQRDQFVLGRREQRGDLVVQVRHDGLHLTARQAAVPIRPGGHGQFGQPPGGAGAVGGVTMRPAGMMAQPRGHRRRPRLLPPLAPVELTHRRDDLRLEPVEQSETLDQRSAVSGDLQLADRPI
jgi:hypothetical protein